MRKNSEWQIDSEKITEKIFLDKITLMTVLAQDDLDDNKLDNICTAVWYHKKNFNL